MVLMDSSWDQVSRVLLAEAQGKPLNPVVSKRTLFGIPSGIERAMEQIARESTERAAQQALERVEGDADDPA